MVHTPAWAGTLPCRQLLLLPMTLSAGFVLLIPWQWVAGAHVLHGIPVYVFTLSPVGSG